MSKHKCVVNNPDCVNGWVVVKGQVVDKCKCVYLKAVKKAYENYARANVGLRKRFEKLEDAKVGTLDYEAFLEEGGQTKQHFKTTQTNKELGYKIIDNFENLAQNKAKIIVYGVAGTGKTQFGNSLIFEMALREQLSYYLPSRDIYDAVFDYHDKEKKKLNLIYDRVQNAKTKLLVIDDLGSEMAKGNDNRMNEMLVHLNNIVRDFQEHDGIILITTNMVPNKLKEAYQDDARIFDMLYQRNKTGYYEFSSNFKFRQKEEKNVLGILD